MCGGIVTHTLSTILLTGQELYSAALAAERVEALCKRMTVLAGMIEVLPEPARPAIQQAAESLMKNLRLFLATIPN